MGQRMIKMTIIIITFFMAAIECQTEALENHKFELPVYFKKTSKAFKGSEKGEYVVKESPYTSLDHTIKLSLGDMYTGEMIWQEYTVPKDPEDTDENFLTQALKAPLEPYIKGIPNDAAIKSIRVNLCEDFAVINMTAEYDLSGYGTTAEYMALRSLTSTIAQYYDVHKIFIQVDGKPYSSGHFYFSEKDYVEIVTEDN